VIRSRGADIGRGMSGRLLCPVCADVIGVYEPLLVIGAASARLSSLAREPVLRRGEDVIVHRACGSALGVTWDDASTTGEPRASDL
jgi:hypothetical protein